jgi:hypothetical protein
MLPNSSPRSLVNSDTRQYRRQHAILNGIEQITKPLLDAIRLDHTAEASNPQRPIGRRNGRGKSGS